MAVPGAPSLPAAEAAGLVEAPVAALTRRTAGSTSLSQQRTHEHTWQLKGLTRSHFTSAVPGELRCSPRFSAFGFSWRLQLAPNGNSAPLAGGVGAYLQLRTEGCTTPEVSFTLRIGAHAFACEQRFCTSAVADERVTSWGATCLVTHEALLDDFETNVPGGALDLQVKMLLDVDAADNDEALDAAHTPCLAADLGALLASGAGADVQLVCSDGERLGAHSALLCARSPVFAAQLREGPLQADTSAVPVPPEITSQMLRRLLHFIYTDELEPASPEEATHLLNAADHYDVPRLFAVCERALCGALSVDNAADTLMLADQHAAVKLKHAALRFVAKNALAVMATPGWAHLVTARPPLVLEAMHTLAAGEPPAPAEGGDAGEAGGACGDGAARRVRRRVH
jgi:speckle-type POZ protein